MAGLLDQLAIVVRLNQSPIVVRFLGQVVQKLHGSKAKSFKYSSISIQDSSVQNKCSSGQ
jgi:hypothetical protein